MHISEGVLSASVLGAGAAASIGFLVYGFREMKDELLTKTALMSSLFFVGSFIHVPLGPSSVHLLLNGLVGAVLGFAAFPAIFMALLLQGLLFQFGGITTLGVNTFDAAFPAVCAFFIFRKAASAEGILRTVLFFLTGFVPVALSSLLVALMLFLSGGKLFQAAQAIFLAHVPVMLIEGTATVFILRFIMKVYPSLLEK
ncbi:cobalt transporter CbiM [Geovibrio thiophilus]|uniref:Cobalt transporter CbiM n=1 Tax=Geovibrio thiophilus TaxID=139438 RepID=A0A3R6AWK8_9BACT|nr:cobalt transporter CbiM [Geovibrio thiophilus]QAR32185.1 cobalt transporter CbiM [Geovibrio thiophilus]